MREIKQSDIKTNKKRNPCRSQWAELESSLSTSAAVLLHLFICIITGSNPMKRHIYIETNADHNCMFQRE